MPNIKKPSESYARLMSAMSKLDAIGIVVADIAKAAEFYGMLGVEFPNPEDGPHVEATLSNGLRLMLDSVDMVKEMDPNWEAPTGHRMALAFLCDSPAQVDEVCRKVAEAGHQVHKEPWDAFWGQRYAQVIDPDGNIVDLFAPLEA